jgi:uncharacterized protein (TIGR00730 family)
MGELSDAYLSLPGGIGTLDELFEVLSWTQLRLEDKPSGLLNVAGFFDDLISYLDRATADGFIRLQHRDLLSAERDVSALLDLLFSRAASRSR